MAEHVQVALRSLEMHFRATTGRTMAAEIFRLRLERAKRLLENGQPIKDVVRDCGFGTVNHFHKAFRAAEGTTPREYRRQRKPAKG